MKKSILLFVAASAIAVYRAFICMWMWNWFATKLLHVGEASFFEVLGLMWVVQLLTSQGFETNEHQWKLLWHTIEAIISDEQREKLRPVLEQFNEPAALSMLAITNVAKLTITLVLGFLVHVLFV
jgi:hypothetical protein